MSARPTPGDTPAETPANHDERPAGAGDLAHELARLDTERSRPDLRLETMDVAGLVAAQLENDRAVQQAVEAAAPQITAALEAVVARLEAGGRLVYVGAGTPGRLAVLDAAECLPTFGAGPETVTALMAGGEDAMITAVEGAEDDARAGAADVRAAGVGPRDVVVGITASGRTPYVVAAVTAAREEGAATVGITNNAGTALAAAAEHPIETLTGPELVAGSTRLKAGTAQKQVLNMLSTIAMIRLGKVYGNLMVDVHVTNEKLRVRGQRIVMEATGAGPEEAEGALAAAGGHAKVAIAALLLDVAAGRARELLDAAGGHLGAVLPGQGAGR
ncbi:N-acetylmuramic acid 6-phosphate etherase [Isoptericola cucumis]|uniref:N-acetylmuramic acid 6-phosphate etherase n=1 Tax=Isoptericola cucumis TaxID=1776856 RepID=UPI00320AD6EA